MTTFSSEQEREMLEDYSKALVSIFGPGQFSVYKANGSVVAFF